MNAAKLTTGLIFTCIAALLSAAVATSFTRNTPVSPGSPSLYLASPVVELGYLSPGEEREVVFSVANNGRRRLVINEVDRGCGCSEQVNGTIVVPPGGTQQVIVRIDTGFAPGRLERPVSFTTNDPVHPRFDLTITATVQAGALRRP